MQAPIDKGIKDYVIDGVTGYLANPEDSKSFSEAIQKCFELSKCENIKINCINKSKNLMLIRQKL